MAQNPDMTESPIQRTIEAVWRMESAKIIATLTRMLRQLGLAEECAQDALVSALEQWPRSGLPDNPAAWLMTAARNRALDELRHRKLIERNSAAIAYESPLGLSTFAAPDRAADDDIGSAGNRGGSTRHGCASRHDFAVAEYSHTDFGYLR